MKIISASLALALAVFLWGTSDARAQNRTTTGSPQQNQQVGLGTAGQSAFGQVGQSPFAQPGAQRSTQSGLSGQQGGFGNQQRLGQTQGARQGDFVGTSAQQMRDQRMNDPRTRRRMMFDFAIESLNEIRDSRRRERSNRNRNPPVRVRIRPLLSVPQPTATEVNLQVQANLDRAMPAAVRGMRISLEGGTATIEGAAQSDYDRRLAEKMLSIQPGITQVENRITVDSVQQPLLPVPGR
ncbi:MAG: BON domain-containing protein [Bythopirellula sp.]